MSRSKFKIGDKVMTTSKALYPKTSYLMGTVCKIYSVDDTTEKKYDIHYGITDVPDEKNVPENDLKFYPYGVTVL